MGYVRASNLHQESTVEHGFFDRRDGTSTSPFDSLNVGMAVGDVPERVEANRARIAQKLQRAPASLVFAEQVHGATCAVVDSPLPLAPKADILLTRRLDLTLALYTADCVPVLLYADGVVGAAHAGWKGTALNVVGQAARAVATLASTHPSRLTVALGPAIGPCCYQVDVNVADALKRIADGAGVTMQSKTHARVDLWKLNETLLRASGVNRIETLQHCTHCLPQYFSHRREQGRTGRHASLIGLRS